LPSDMMSRVAAVLSLVVLASLQVEVEAGLLRGSDTAEKSQIMIIPMGTSRRLSDATENATSVTMENQTENMTETMTDVNVSTDDSTTQAPNVSIDDSTTQAPNGSIDDSTTQAPNVSIDDSTTKAPNGNIDDSTTQAPNGSIDDSTTQAPNVSNDVSTTQAPNVSSNDDSTTQAPDATTQVPDSTTQAPAPTPTTEESTPANTTAAPTLAPAPPMNQVSSVTVSGFLIVEVTGINLTDDSALSPIRTGIAEVAKVPVESVVVTVTSAGRRLGEQFRVDYKITMEPNEGGAPDVRQRLASNPKATLTSSIATALAAEVPGASLTVLSAPAPELEYETDDANSTTGNTTTNITEEVTVINAATTTTEQVLFVENDEAPGLCLHTLVVACLLSIGLL